MNSDKLMICKLLSGRQIMIVVNNDGSRCSYRYLGEKEIDNNEFDTYGIFNWIEAPIRTDIDIDSNKYIAFIEVENQLIRWYVEDYNSPIEYNIHNLGRFV